MKSRSLDFTVCTTKCTKILLKISKNLLNLCGVRKMTDLTKDWKDGKLSDGWYYIKIADIVFIDFFEGKVWKNKKDEYIDEVLAQVPSYKEWIGVKQQRDLENKLRHDSDNKNWQLRTENTQLKELLKECKEVIKNVDTYYGNYDSTNGYLVINKINEALR